MPNVSREYTFRCTSGYSPTHGCGVDHKTKERAWKHAKRLNRRAGFGVTVGNTYAVHRSDCASLIWDRDFNCNCREQD